MVGIKGFEETAAGGRRPVPIGVEKIAGSKGLYALKTTATLSVGDIQLGAVELKNHDTDDRAFIDTLHNLAVKQQLDDKYQPVNLTTTDANKKDLALSGITEAHKFSFVMENGDGYLAFDEDADNTKIFLKDGEGYSDDEIKFTSKISIIRDAGVDVTLRGVIWGI